MAVNSLSTILLHLSRVCLSRNPTMKQACTHGGLRNTGFVFPLEHAKYFTYDNFRQMSHKSSLSVFPNTLQYLQNNLKAVLFKLAMLDHTLPPTVLVDVLTQGFCVVREKRLAAEILNVRLQIANLLSFF